MHPFPQPMCAGGGRPQTWTWDPASKDVDVTLSNGDRTMAVPTAFDGSVKGTVGKGSGAKWYFDAVVNNATSVAIGIGNAPFNVAIAPGSGGTSTGWTSAGAFKVNGSAIATYATYAANDVIGYAFDTTANKVWVSKNNVWQAGDPNTGTGGVTISNDTYFPVAYGVNGGQVTVNAVTTYAPPSGFSAF